ALKNPANDARDMAASLRSLGFDVILRTDVRQKDMLRSLTEFGEKLQAGAEALFFYAGHGMQVRSKNYLIPVDAEIRSESSVSSEAVDVDQLLDKLSPARLSMVILDACRNNPFERRFRGGGRGLAQINAPAGTLIAYATAPGKVAADGEGRNGLYTSELLAAMDVPGIKIEDVFKRVRANVVRKSGEAQTPWESSSLTGDFFFRSGENGTAPASVPTAVPATTASAIELAFWKSAEQSNTEAEYQAYLDKYPGGQFAALARARIAPARQPGRGTEPSAIAGIWHWSVNSFLVPDRTNTIKADGTCQLNTGTTCVWTYEDADKRKIAFRFSDTWTHTMTLSADGRTLKGTDDWGTAVTGTKAGMNQ
ncbi:MAG: caspase family protein, partial [Sulfuritalea sp.]|nr:caspase family protein [Sulfuritalea sp.]